MKQIKLYLAIIASCLMSQTLLAQGVLDIPPRGQQNERAVTGGGQRVAIDRKTPLPKLIRRLEEDWREIETGKAYWIGYTKDMYSIAAHGDGAIDPLLNFIKTTKLDRAKYGAILALHLIGIESRIAGRFYEEFKNKEARQALLGLLPQAYLRGHVMRLLVRDPWSSDVPSLMSVMEQSKDDCWTIVNGLFRYKLDGVPFRQPVPKPLAEKTVAFEQPENFTSDEFLWDILKAMKKVAGKSLVLEEGLLKKSLWGYSRSGYGGANAGPKAEPFGKLLNEIVEARGVFSYCNLGNRIQYYVEKEKVYIYSSRKAKERWMTWWGKESDKYEKSLGENTEQTNQPDKK